MPFYHAIRPAAFMFSAEQAHQMAVWTLKHQLLLPQPAIKDSKLAMNIAGLHFSNPVGMAAGFDKNAEAINGLARQGFGFIEAGTVTPLPQSGNPKPRLFRLKEDEAVINRMGFNNDGAAVFAENLAKRNTGNVLVGVNIGKNKASTDAVADYIILLEQFYYRCDYITINISSPNTPGLRALQKQEALQELLHAIAKERELLKKQHKKNVPIFLKIAPDVTDEESEAIVEAVLEHGIDGIIVSNTTIGEREALKSTHKNETGGLSGSPLFSLSTEKLCHIYRLSKGKVPLIGVGGIASAEDAYAKIKAGASVIQLYSALVYHGFDLVNEINRGLITLLEKDGLSHLSEAVGVNA